MPGQVAAPDPKALGIERRGPGDERCEGCKHVIHDPPGSVGTYCSHPKVVVRSLVTNQPILLLAVVAYDRKDYCGGRWKEA